MSIQQLLAHIINSTFKLLLNYITGEQLSKRRRFTENIKLEHHQKIGSHQVSRAKQFYQASDMVHHQETDQPTLG